MPLNETLIIASLLKWEARTLSDMRTISGVIWNRRFADMKLQIDATLQYAGGTEPYHAQRANSLSHRLIPTTSMVFPPTPISNPLVAGRGSGPQSPSD